jgi:hypothetical protein
VLGGNLISYIVSNWELIIVVVLAVVALGSAAWFLKNWKIAVAAVVIAAFGFAYQSANMAGFDRAVAIQTAERTAILQGRLNALQTLALKDNMQAQLDAKRINDLESIANDTPKNDGFCLDASAVGRVQSIR